MTDDHEPSQPPSSNGAAPAGAVRSGLAQRRNPFLKGLREFTHSARRLVFRDPIALFLLLASIGLGITFAVLLGQIKPQSAGSEVPISTVQALATHKEIASAVVLDHDARVEVTRTEGVLES